MVYMAKNQQGTILDKFGLPIIFEIIQSNDDLVVEAASLESRPDFTLLPVEFETETDKILVVQFDRSFAKKNAQEISTTSVKNQFLANLLLTHDDVKIVENLLYGRIEKVLRTYDENMLAVPAYLFGQMLIPGSGVSSFVLEVSGTGSDRLDADLFMWTKEKRAVVVCILRQK